MPVKIKRWNSFSVTNRSQMLQWLPPSYLRSAIGHEFGHQLQYLAQPGLRAAETSGALGASETAAIEAQANRIGFGSDRAAMAWLSGYAQAYPNTSRAAFSTAVGVGVYGSYSGLNQLGWLPSFGENATVTQILSKH